MIYEHFGDLPALIADKMLTARKHPGLPIWVYNYSAKAQHTPMGQWTPAMCDCRGLILTETGEVVARPFRKFWNYSQVLDQIPNEPFTVWEKLDGSLAIVCTFNGERVVATRGSFESEQALWASRWFDRHHSDFYPDCTYLFEILFAENRIVVDYGKREECVLLAIHDETGVDLWQLFEKVERFTKARRFDGILDFKAIESDPQFAGEEGFVLQWESGYRAKQKLSEYVRLHRLITQCSTRTIWEMLRTGADTTELTDRVPADFLGWAQDQIGRLQDRFLNTKFAALDAFAQRPDCPTRKDFAEYAKQQPNPGLLFSLLDSKPIDDAIWKLVEPAWATPFRGDPDA